MKKVYYLLIVFFSLLCATFSQAEVLALEAENKREGCSLVQSECKSWVTSNFGGNQVSWCDETAARYTCGSDNPDTSDCQQLIDRGCTAKTVEDKCVEYEGTRCISWQRELSCPVGNGEVASETCAAIKFCETDEETGVQRCYDNSYSPDKDMAKVVALLETGRQMGVYGSQKFFNGEAYHCRLGSFGIGSSCCFVSDTPKGRNGEKGTANSVMMSAVWAGVKYGYNYTKALASPYVSDAIMAAKSFITGGASAATGAASAAAGGGAAVGFNFSYMGFGYATAGAAPAGAISIGNAGFYFSPQGLAIAVAAYVIMQVLMCSPSDQENKLAMLRGSNLCQKVGSYCAKKTLGICRQRKNSYCCWNSTLGKIIAVQGRQQLGKSMGSAKNPNCEGFTMEEFQKLDLSKMDMSEFLAEVKTNTLGIKDSGVSVEDQDFWTERANTRLDTIQANVNSNLKLDSYAENRDILKESIIGRGEGALESLDVQYELGTKPDNPYGKQETYETINDPYKNR